MKIYIRLLSLFGLFIATPLVLAGSTPESSLVRGYFLGFPGFSYISGNFEVEYKRELHPVCKARGRLWALGVDARFECVSVRRVENDVDGAVYELKIESDKPIKRTHALLYSTRPFADEDWYVRAFTESESRELMDTPTLKLAKYRKVLGHISQGKARVIDPKNGRLKIYILPWKTTSDGIADDKDYIIATRLQSGAISFREARGTIIGFADLDGDGIPEIQNSQNCDGVCESMLSVTAKSGEVISINIH